MYCVLICICNFLCSVAKNNSPIKVINYYNLLWIGNLSSNKGSESTAAIGGAVGGAILLIFVVTFIIVIFCMKRSHRYKEKTIFSSHQELQAKDSYNKSSADNNNYKRNPDTMNTSSFIMSNPLLDLIDRDLTESSEG